ncbi:hypothetical protein V6615_02560 [Oscillospiraceae bacterium PP1C4]
MFEKELFGIKKRLIALLSSMIVLNLAACQVQSTPSSSQSELQSCQSEFDSIPSKSEAEIQAFTVPNMNDEQRKYNEQYLYPILVTGLLIRDWSTQDYSSISADPSGASNGSYLILAFEDMVGKNEMQKLWERYNGKFPEQIVEDVLLSHFPFTVEQLHEILSYHYKADEKLYYYEGGRGGGPIDCAVTNVKSESDGSVKVEYAIFSGYYDEASTAEKEAYLYKTPGTLTLQPTNTDRYLYWSVDVGEEVEAQPS